MQATTPLSVTLADQPTVTAVSGGGQSNAPRTAFAAPLVADKTGQAASPALTGTRPGTVTVTAVSGDANATFTDTVVTPTADLSVTLTAPDYVRPGARLKVTATVANRGPNAASGLRVVVAIPPGFRPTDLSGGTRHGSAVVFVAPSGLAVNAHRSCTLTLTAPSKTPRASSAFGAGATSVTKDPRPRNNQASALVRVG